MSLIIKFTPKKSTVSCKVNNRERLPNDIMNLIKDKKRLGAFIKKFDGY